MSCSGNHSDRKTFRVEHEKRSGIHVAGNVQAPRTHSPSGLRTRAHVVPINFDAVCLEFFFKQFVVLHDKKLEDKRRFYVRNIEFFDRFGCGGRKRGRSHQESNKQRCQSHGFLLRDFV